MDPIVISLVCDIKEKSNALTKKILTYHSVTEWTSSSTTATVWRPSFQFLNSFLQSFKSQQLSWLPKTISQFPSRAFFSSSSTSAENPSRFSCSTWSRITEIKGETTMIVVIVFWAALVRRRKSWRIKLLPNPVGGIAKTFLPRAKFIIEISCSFLSAYTSWKSLRHSAKIACNLKSSNSYARTTPAIMLIEGMLMFPVIVSKLTNQRVYQELVYGRRVVKESFTGSPSAPSPRPRSISFARSRSLASTIAEPGTG